MKRRRKKFSRREYISSYHSRHGSLPRADQISMASKRARSQAMLDRGFSVSDIQKVRKAAQRALRKNYRKLSK